MFFIVSGVLFSGRSWLELIEKRFYSLVLPYVSFLLLLIVLITIRSAALGEANPYFSRSGVKQIVLGGAYLKWDFGVFWFIPCLFFTQLLYNALILPWKSAYDGRLIGAVAAIYAVGYGASLIVPLHRIPLAIGIVPFSLPLLWFGNLMKQPRLDWRFGLLLCATVIGLAIVLATAGVSFRVDMKNAKVGPPFLGIALAAALTWLFFLFNKALCRVRQLRKSLAVAGAASIAVLFLHQFVHFSLRKVGVDSEPVLIAAGVLLPMLVWAVARHSTWVRALFLGAGPGDPVKQRVRLALDRLGNRPV